jgi:DNA-binding response OmpR family regulator
MVDDDRDTREMYAWCLDARGFDVSSAPIASAAIELAELRRPDVIVTDFMLPGEDGLHLAERVRASVGMSATPMILVSGRAFVADSGVRASELFDRILLKPVLPDQLIENLAAVMLERTAAELQRQLHDVRTRLASVPRTSDVSRILEALNEVAAGGDAPAALLADSAAHCVAVNDAACALTGRSREELLSLQVSDVTSPRTLVASAAVLPGYHLSLLQSIPPALLGTARL